MKLYCMTVHKDNKTTAGAKAPDDISKIARNLGAEEVIFKTAHKFNRVNITRFFAAFTGVKNWMRLLCKIEMGSYVIIQHPNENILVANKMINICKRIKKSKFIFLIHDLESLRKNLIQGKGKLPDNRGVIADEVLLKKADYIICHNIEMKRYLVSQGFHKNRIVELQIFDYLHNCTLTDERKKDNSIIIAGNLMKEKAGYLYKLAQEKDLNFKINLFGPNYIQTADNKRIEYFGQCLPDELPEKMQGSFGLVWDGREIEGCHGNAGEYIRYNNPHKCSLFLASNIPVIIWKEAALASFIEKNKVGFTIQNLKEIGEKLPQISEEEYRELVLNAEKVGKKLREGYYFKNALTKIMNREEL